MLRLDEGDDTSIVLSEVDGSINIDVIRYRAGDQTA